MESSTDVRGKNASYWSETIQNEIIDTLGNYISSKIITEVKKSRMFFIMADEAADFSKKEKLSLVLCFVDSSKNIPEDFVGFRQCGVETTGNAIKEFITNLVRDLGLTMDNCRGQSYDSTGDMADRYVRASTLIQNQGFINKKIMLVLLCPMSAILTSRKNKHNHIRNFSESTLST